MVKWHASKQASKQARKQADEPITWRNALTKKLNVAHVSPSTWVQVSGKALTNNDAL